MPPPAVQPPAGCRQTSGHSSQLPQSAGCWPDGSSVLTFQIAWARGRSQASHQPGLNCLPGSRTPVPAACQAGARLAERLAPIMRCRPAAARWPAHGGQPAGGDTLRSARRLQRMASRASSLPSYTGSHPPVQVKTKGTGRRIWLRLAGSHLRPPRHLAARQSVGLQSAADGKAGRQASKQASGGGARL